MIYFNGIKKSYYCGNPQFCIGNKEECSLFVDNGSVRIPWGQAIDSSSFKQIECLALLPTEKQIRNIDKYKSLLEKLPDAKKIILPIEFLDNFNKMFLSWEVLDISKISPIIRGKKYHLSNVYFDHLLSITINDQNALHENIEIRNENVPKLEYIETPVADKGFTSIINLSSHNMLKHLILRHCKSKDLDPLEGKYLKTLGITDFSKKIDVIKKIDSLEIIYLNTIRNEIDCSIFLELPMLKEISILHSKKITNIEALLRCKNLESVYLFKCNNPIGSSKHLFLDRNYKYLNIDHG